MEPLKVTWLGHAAFKFLSPGGKSVIIDPWVMNNPACPDSLKRVTKLDLMLVTHGHFDHIGDCVALAKQHPAAKVVCIYETSVWLGSKGVQNALGMNKGGTQSVDGIKVTMVNAEHSCGIQDGDRIVYGGEPCGYVVQFESGFTVYHAGDTNVFGDMKIIGDLYSPDLCLLPIGGLYTMSPREATYACQFLGAQRVVPMHYGTFPALAGTPADFREQAEGIVGLDILVMKPGETLSFDVEDPRKHVGERAPGAPSAKKRAAPRRRVRR